mmetsp:Transcript_3669/g.5801  ORF Transcript_3669/g.5801 Transcript_3669/m.5801 type:complete len:177 (-) Transcript_3669:252-782(-)
MLPSLARPAKSIKDIEEQYGVNWLKWRPTALLEAAWKGDNESVASLVQFYKVSGDGHVINHQDGNGNTALIFASSAGQLKTVKFLIAAARKDCPGLCFVLFRPPIPEVCGGSERGWCSYGSGTEQNDSFSVMRAKFPNPADWQAPRHCWAMNKELVFLYRNFGVGSLGYGVRGSVL